VEGAKNVPYAFPNLLVQQTIIETPVPLGFWRSVGSSHNAFVTEAFFDEIARAARRDPYELRREMLAQHPRHLAALDLAADKAGWGKPLPEGRFRGIAVAESFASFVAEVAEISVESDGRPRVHRVVAAVECGPCVNPESTAAQIESGIVFGLTAALHGEITLEGGRVRQSNFHDYPLLRLQEMPRIETYVVPSTEKIGGIGEPSTPPIAPALANAIHSATGKPVRTLPILSATRNKTATG
jgi:isoquinoline 1-oxidoreductase beta subunit